VHSRNLASAPSSFPLTYSGVPSSTFAGGFGGYPYGYGGLSSLGYGGVSSLGYGGLYGSPYGLGSGLGYGGLPSLGYGGLNGYGFGSDFGYGGLSSFGYPSYSGLHSAYPYSGIGGFGGFGGFGSPYSASTIAPTFTASSLYGNGYPLF